MRRLPLAQAIATFRHYRNSLLMRSEMVFKAPIAIEESAKTAPFPRDAIFAGETTLREINRVTLWKQMPLTSEISDLCSKNH
jgi:hypothetical protein